MRFISRQLTGFLQINLGHDPIALTLARNASGKIQMPMNGAFAINQPDGFVIGLLSLIKAQAEAQHITERYQRLNVFGRICHHSIENRNRFFNRIILVQHFRTLDLCRTIHGLSGRNERKTIMRRRPALVAAKYLRRHEHGNVAFGFQK